MSGGQSSAGQPTGGQRTGGGPGDAEPAVTGRHRWTYRGQIIPGCERVEVFASITDVDDAHKHLRADGFLTVDGQTIYAMNDFTLDVIA
jgi:adenylate cyclase class IV